MNIQKNTAYKAAVSSCNVKYLGLLRYWNWQNPSALAKNIRKNQPYKIRMMTDTTIYTLKMQHKLTYIKVVRRVD